MSACSNFRGYCCQFDRANREWHKGESGEATTTFHAHGAARCLPDTRCIPQQAKSRCYPFRAILFGRCYRRGASLRAELKVTHLRCDGAQCAVSCGFLRRSSVFCENLRFSPVSCALQMLEFPGEGVNLRKSAVFCENLRFGLSLSL